MTTTPQTNTTLKALAEEMLQRDDFVLCGHVSPDGDCISSQLALMHALRRAGKRVRCVLAGDDSAAEPALSFLPGFTELLHPSDVSGDVGVFVGVDVPTVERIGTAAALHAKASLRITIDHHAVDSTMSELVYVDPDAAAAALLVWELASYLVEERDADIAQCAYTGLTTDTGRFQYQNTDAACFEAAAQMVAAGADPALVAREVFQNRSVASVRLESLAVERMIFAGEGSVAVSWVAASDFEKLEATKADAEPLVNALRGIQGVRIACMLREQDGAVRGSLRAKDDTDISVLARSYGGGGHKAAAGFTLHEPLRQAVERVTRDLQELAERTAVSPAHEGARQ